jgi:hypothetical protein
MKKTQVGHMHNVQMLMNVVWDYTTAIKKPNVPIHKVHIAVSVNEVLLAMENIHVQERKFHKQVLY